jgi:hypothetical protein
MAESLTPGRREEEVEVDCRGEELEVDCREEEVEVDSEGPAAPQLL